MRWHRVGSIRNKNNWNKASKRLFGSYSHSGIPGFPSGYSAPRSRIAGIYSGIHSYSGIFPNERALNIHGVLKAKNLTLLLRRTHIILNWTSGYTLSKRCEINSVNQVPSYISVCNVHCNWLSRASACYALNCIQTICKQLDLEANLFTCRWNIRWPLYYIHYLATLARMVKFLFSSPHSVLKGYHIER